MQGKAASKARASPGADSSLDASTRAVWLVGAGWGVRAAVLLSLVLCRPFVQRNIRMSSKVLGGLGAAAAMGSTGGALLSGLVTDAYGRKRSLGVFMAVSLLGMYVTSRARGHVHLIVGHALVGIGAGGEVPSAVALLCELAARPSHGARSVAHLGVFTALGGAVGVALSMVVAPQIGWREFYRSGSIANTVLLAAMMAWLPESSRWEELSRRRSCFDLSVDAKIEMALPVLDPGHAKLLRTDLKNGYQILPANGNCLRATPAFKAHIKTLALYSTLLAALSTSTYVFTVYVPTLLSLQTFSVFEKWLPMIVIRIAEAFGAFAGVVVTARRGFKHTLRVFIPLTVASAVGLVTIASLATSSTRADKSWNAAAPLVLTVGTTVVAMFASGSWSCALAETSTHFPVSWRGRGVGLVFAVASAADSVGSYLYPHLFNDLRLSPLVITALFGVLAMTAMLPVVASPERFQPTRESAPLLKSPSADSTHSKTSDEDGDDDLRQKLAAQRTALTRRGERGATV